MNGPLRTFTLTLLLFAALLSTAGAQWRQVPRSVLTAAGSPSGSFFNEVFFYDNNYGWVTEGGTTVLYTTNGGSTPYSTATDTASLTIDPDVDAVQVEEDGGPDVRPAWRPFAAGRQRPPVSHSPSRLAANTHALERVGGATRGAQALPLQAVAAALLANEDFLSFSHNVAV